MCHFWLLVCVLLCAHARYAAGVIVTVMCVVLDSLDCAALDEELDSSQVPGMRFN